MNQFTFIHFSEAGFSMKDLAVKHHLFSMKFRLRHMSRLLASAAFFILTSVPTMAQDAGQRLVVWLKSGEKVYYQLTDEPKTTFTDGKLSITSSTVNVTYDLPEVIRYTYDGAVTKIDAPKTGRMGFRQNDEVMILDFIPAGTKISIYNTQGILIKSITADGSAETPLSFSAMPSGVYIINVGDHSLKFTKR